MFAYLPVKKISEEKWRAAFAFENVRIDCTRHDSWQEEPIIRELLYKKRQELVRLFKFGDCFAEFTLLGAGTEKNFARD